jgi:hypothetical protein
VNDVAHLVTTIPHKYCKEFIRNIKIVRDSHNINRHVELKISGFWNKIICFDIEMHHDESFAEWEKLWADFVYYRNGSWFKDTREKLLQHKKMIESI